MIQIAVYDKTLNLLTLIENHQELVFKRSFYNIGQFTIVINSNLIGADSLLDGNIVMIGGDVTKCGIITRVSKKIDENGKGSEITTATGFELKYIFSQRLVYQLNQTNIYSLTGPAETVIKTLISDQCGPTATNTKRRLSILQIATDQARGSSYSINAKYTNLAQEACTAAIQGGIGWYAYLDLTNKKIILDCKVGLNRTRAQSTNAWCIFSPDYDSLRSAEIVNDISSYRNFVYVGGSGVGPDRIVNSGYGSSEPTDIDRYEAYLDKPSSTATADLAAQASAFLRQYQQTLTIDGQALVKSQFVLDRDYANGDTIELEYSGVNLQTQIIEVEEAWQAGNYNIALTWGKETATQSSQIGSLSNGATVANTTSESGNNVSAQRNGVKVYDFSSGNVTQDAADTVYNVLSLTGTLTAQRTLTLSLNGTTLYGRKAYTIIMKATAYPVVISAGGSSSAIIMPIVGTGYTVQQIWIDDSGSVYSSDCTIFGSNANGSYRKFSDGTLECRARIVRTGTVPIMETNTYGSTSGNLYVEFSSFVFPSPFLSGTVPDIAHSYSKMPFGWIIDNSRSSGSLSNTGGVIQWVSNTSGSQTIELSYIAIGRWR